MSRSLHYSRLAATLSTDLEVSSRQVVEQNRRRIPEAVAAGKEQLLIIGAIAGG